MNSIVQIWVLLLGSFLIHHHTQAQVNVALNKRATQLSNHISNKGGASNAVDGITDGRWQSGSVTHTKSEGEKNPWWTVDLGEVYEISKIRIWNRTDCCAERLDNFKILVKSQPSGESWRSFVPGTQRNTGRIPLVFEGNAQGRYVMIQLVSSSGILSLAEVEVYGTKAQSTQPPAASLNAREGTFFIKARHSDKNISVKNANKEDGAILWQWKFHGKAQQQFKLESAGNGYFFIRAMHSGKYMTVKNAGQENGAEIVQWPKIFLFDNTHQQFAFQSVPGGYYHIRARHSGKYLSIKHAGQEDGSILWQWELHGNAQQQFKLEDAPAFDSGTQVAIKVDLGLWVSRCVDCQPMAIYKRNTASAHMKDIYPRNTETFTWLNYGDKVALKADNGFYLKSCHNCAKDNPNAIISIEPLPNGQAEPSGPYLFTVKRLPNGKFTFQSDNGRYWTRFYRGNGAKHIIATYRPSADIDQAYFEVSELENAQINLPILEDEKNHVMKDVKKTMFDNFTTTLAALRVPPVINPIPLTYPYNNATWHTTIISAVNSINYLPSGRLVIGRNDHPNSMTMTKSGRIVFDCSRVKTEGANEGSAIIFSSPGSMDNLQRDSWFVNTTVYPSKLVSGKEIYSDRMQAAGEILMVTGTDERTRFYKILSDNTLDSLTHLSNDLNGRSFFAFAYSPADQRYYALYNKKGGSKDYSSSSNVEMEVWATEPGRSLRDPNTRFRIHYTVEDIPMSQQGAHLMVQEDGTLFLLNAFVFEPNGDLGLIGGLSCSNLTGHDRPWKETLALTRIRVPGASLPTQTWTKKIGIVPHPVPGVHPCIDVRPSWRYAGAFTATGPSSGVILWSSRWKSAFPGKDKLERTYEYASRVMK
jgi:hypothetical protein